MDPERIIVTLFLISDENKRTLQLGLHEIAQKSQPQYQHNAETVRARHVRRRLLPGGLRLNPNVQTPRLRPLDPAQPPLRRHRV
jgi:hypothetical protein